VSDSFVHVFEDFATLAGILGIVPWICFDELSTCPLDFTGVTQNKFSPAILSLEKRNPVGYIIISQCC